MTALVGGDGDGLGVLLDGRLDDVGGGSVVAQVDHFDAGRLQDPAHDVDGGVVPVKQRGRGHDPNVMVRLIGHLPKGYDASVGSAGRILSRCATT